MSMKSRCIDIVKSVENVSLSYILSTAIWLVSVCVSDGPFVALLSVLEIEASLAIKVKIERSLTDCKVKLSISNSSVQKIGLQSRDSRKT